MQAPIKHDEVKANVMKRWGLVIFFSAVLMGHAEAGPSALALGYCASDFDVCYTNCRISNPDPSFIGDRARVICGQSCFQQRQQVRSPRRWHGPFCAVTHRAIAVRGTTRPPTGEAGTSTSTDTRLLCPSGNSSARTGVRRRIGAAAWLCARKNGIENTD